MHNVILNTLKKWNACSDGFEYVEQQASVKSAWTNCQRGDWMLWYAENCDVDKKLLMLTAIQCARLVQHLMKDQRSIDAIDVAERYCNGEATKIEWEQAANRAADACAAADNRTAYAASAADDAAYAASAASAAAYASDFSADARKKILAQCANIVRDTIDLELIDKDLS